MRCLASATQAGDKKCWGVKGLGYSPVPGGLRGTEAREDMLADGAGATVAARQGQPLLPGQWQQVSGVSEFKEVVAAEASMAQRRHHGGRAHGKLGCSMLISGSAVAQTCLPAQFCLLF